MITRRRGVWTAASACSLTVAIAVGSWGASRSLAEDSRPAALDAELPSVERALQSVSATTTPASPPSNRASMAPSMGGTMGSAPGSLNVDSTVNAS